MKDGNVALFPKQFELILSPWYIGCETTDQENEALVWLRCRWDTDSEN
jgi:hypothetical protein